eukprot:3803953-Pyramimonas_sp.AAC.1
MMLRRRRGMRRTESVASDGDRFRDWEVGLMVSHRAASARYRRAPARRMAASAAPPGERAAK